MKVILTGSTGSIGGHILTRCLQLKEITSLVALSRKPLPESQTHQKLKVLIVKDFGEQYPEEVLKEIGDADACIWSLGNLASREVSNEEKATVATHYPKQFIDAVAAQRSTLGTEGKLFRFMMVGGMVMVRDQSQSVWFLSHLRKTSGQWLNDLDALSQTKSNIDFYAFMPSFVMQQDTWRTRLLSPAIVGRMLAQPGGWMAAAVVNAALNGDENKTLWFRYMNVKGAKIVNEEQKNKS